MFGALYQLGAGANPFGANPFRSTSTGATEAEEARAAESSLVATPTRSGHNVNSQEAISALREMIRLAETLLPNSTAEEIVQQGHAVLRALGVAVPDVLVTPDTGNAGKPEPTSPPARSTPHFSVTPSTDNAGSPGAVSAAMASLISPQAVLGTPELEATERALALAGQSTTPAPKLTLSPYILVSTPNVNTPDDLKPNADQAPGTRVAPAVPPAVPSPVVTKEKIEDASAAE